MTKRKHVLVAINTLTSIQSDAYRDHMNLFYRLGRDFRNIEFHQMVARRMSIDRFRNLAAKMTIVNKYDYLFFIDDDMLFQDPGNVFGPLYKSGFDIVSANTYIRGYPYKVMSFKVQEKCLVNITEEDFANVDSKGILKVAAIGTAVSLISRKVLDKIPAPWFITGQHNTEDIYFCCKAKDYYKRVKIGMIPSVVTGHLLDPEAISLHTKASLKKYQESFMDEVEVLRSNNVTGDNGLEYIKENLDVECA